MTYTPNTPLANQTIASTTTPIRNNFLYNNDSWQKDHTFNGNAVGSEDPGYHQHMSNPGISDPAILPTGISGIYYTSSSSQPKYFNNNQVGGVLLTPCNAFINFNGTGTAGQPLNAAGNSVRNSFNVNAGSSTKVALGIYQIVFTNPLPNNNYCVLVTGQTTALSPVAGGVRANAAYGVNQTTTFVTVQFASDVIMGNV